jgi:hypothetical protein
MGEIRIGVVGLGAIANRMLATFGKSLTWP